MVPKINFKLIRHLRKNWDCLYHTCAELYKDSEEDAGDFRRLAVTQSLAIITKPPVLSCKLLLIIIEKTVEHIRYSCTLSIRHTYYEAHSSKDEN